MSSEVGSKTAKLSGRFLFGLPRVILCSSACDLIGSLDRIRAIRFFVGRVRFWVRRFCANEGGASVIQHGLLACVFALVIVYAAARGVSPTTIYERVARITGVLSIDPEAARTLRPEED